MPRPSRLPSPRPPPAAVSSGVRFWWLQGRAAAPLPEGSAAVGRCRRGARGPRGSVSPRAARVCVGRAPARQLGDPGARPRGGKGERGGPAACAGVKARGKPRPALPLLSSALRGNWSQLPVKEHSWPSWEARGCTKPGARSQEPLGHSECLYSSTQLLERSKELGSVYTASGKPPRGYSRNSSRELERLPGGAHPTVRSPKDSDLFCHTVCPVVESRPNQGHKIHPKKEGKGAHIYVLEFQRAFYSM